MKLYLIRHGQTDWNLHKRVQGATNVPLNATGLAQAADLRRQTADLEFEACYASPLLRAAQTAMIVVDGRTEIIYDSRLKERSHGKFEGQYLPKWDLIKPDIFDREINTNVQGIEPIRSLDARTGEFLQEIYYKYSETAKIMIVAHAGSLKSMLSSIMDYNSPEFRDFRFEQGQVYELDFWARFLVDIIFT